MLLIALVSMTIAVPINVFQGKDYEDWLERTTLNNKAMTNLRSWVHVGLVFFFSILTMNQIVKIRSDARKAYRFFY